MKKLLVFCFLCFLFPSRVFAQVLPPTDKIDSLSFIRYGGKLREVVIKGSTVWWRDSSDQTEKNFSANWVSKSLAEAWPQSVWPAGHPLPTSGVDAQKYQQFFGCGNLGNYVSEVVIKGGEVWYRRSSDINGTDIGSKPFIYTTLTQSWGTAGPPTDYIDSINYDVYDGSPRELVIRGGNVWFRTYNCSASAWSGWTQIPLSQTWGSMLNPPPLTGSLDVYASDYLDTDKSLEIVTQGNSVWSRRSADTNTHHVSDVFRKSTLNDFFQRYSVALPNARVAANFIDAFMAVYGNTDFSQVINFGYMNNDTSRLFSVDNFRALLAQALAHAVRYRWNNNTDPTDLQKAKYLINASADHANIWLNYHHLSGDALRSLLLSSWILWDTLSPEEKTKLHTVAKEEGAYWVAKLKEAQNGGPFLNDINGWVDDTKAETNGAIAEGLAFAANMFPDDPEAATWEETGRCLAYLTITTSQTSAQSRGDTSTRCGVTTQTVYDDFTLDNHNYHPSVLYTLAAIAPLNQAGLGYFINGYAIPSEYRHNTAPLWEKLLSYFHKGDYTIFPQYFRGQDWGDIDVWLAMTDINYLDKIDNSSSLNETERNRLAWDILHYFYTINDSKLRFPTGPVSVMPQSAINGQPTSDKVRTDWFLNTLTHAKGAAEIIVYSNPQLFFCRGNVDIKGNSTHLCNASVPLKTFTSSSDITDFRQLLTAFTNIFDYNKLVGNLGR